VVGSTRHVTYRDLAGNLQDLWFDGGWRVQRLTMGGLTGAPPAGSDPVAWIEANPGRIHSIHCKDWTRARGYQVLLGEGDAPWAAIFKAAESAGGVEYYLIEQEGSQFSALETVERCLANWKKLKA